MSPNETSPDHRIDEIAALQREVDELYAKHDCDAQRVLDQLAQDGRTYADLIDARIALGDRGNLSSVRLAYLRRNMGPSYDL
jgi:hypothetical protein